jgi:hypothetical protein
MAGVTNSDLTLSASDYVNGISQARYRITGDTTWTPSWSVYSPAVNVVRTVLPWSYLSFGTLSGASPSTQIYTTPGNYNLILETVNTIGGTMSTSINFTVTPIAPYGTGIVYRTYQV